VLNRLLTELGSPDPRKSVLALNARSLCVIGAASASWAFSFGLGSQVVSHWLKAQGHSDTVIGLSHSFYYFGLAVASCLVPVMTRRLGPAWCAALACCSPASRSPYFRWRTTSLSGTCCVSSTAGPEP